MNMNININVKHLVDASLHVITLVMMASITVKLAHGVF